MHSFLHKAAEFLGHALHHFAQCRALDQAPSSSPFDGVPNMLTQLLKGQAFMSDNTTKLLEEQVKMRADVAAQTTVIASATAAFTGLAAHLAAAEAAAKANGVTDEALAGFVSVRTGLESNTAALSAAIPANTAAATEQPAATAPADTTTEPAPTAPVSADPSAPTGQEVQI